MSQPKIFLVLASEHPLRAIESVAERMAAGLSCLGLQAVVCTLPRDAAQLGKLPPDQVAGVLSLGPMPLAVEFNRQPFWTHFPCPISVYLLDALLYDIARVPVMRRFLDAAQRDSRLGLVSPEQGYRDWLGRDLGVRWDHLPFAAFPRVSPGQSPVPAQPRLCVIGTIGSELGGSPAGESLAELLARSVGRFADAGRRAHLADALLATDAEAMPARALARLLDWGPVDVVQQEPLAALIAVDSWIKRDRRLRAVRSLAGLPVDFFGTGWEALLGPVAGFRHVGQVHHDDIALLMQNYAGVLSFDPNWDGGVHDRVYTAAAMGVTVVTNHNTGLQAAGLPDDLVITYPANAPALASRLGGSGLFGDTSRFNAPRADVLARHNWGTRMAQWLGAEPRESQRGVTVEAAGARRATAELVD